MTATQQQKPQRKLSEAWEAEAVNGGSPFASIPHEAYAKPIKICISAILRRKSAADWRSS
ncbi:hypothetical protein BDV09DRAFT_167917 [Aspergillus tetrazonus]